MEDTVSNNTLLLQFVTRYKMGRKGSSAFLARVRREDEARAQASMRETGKTLLQAGEDTLRSHPSPSGPRNSQLPDKITRTEAEESVEKILNGDATKYE